MYRFLLLAVLALLLGGCRQQVLFSDVPQRDANEMVAALQRSGIDVTVEPGAQPRTMTLKVAEDASAEATGLLARLGLPRPVKTPLSEMLPKDSWMSSQAQENARVAYGMGEDLSGTLTQINGVRDARVHVALAQKNTVGKIEVAPSASVLVRYDPELLGPEFRDDIAALVANAVPGLRYDRVAVTMMPDTGDGASSISAGSNTIASASSTVDLILRLVMGAMLASLIGWLYLNRRARSAQ